MGFGIPIGRLTLSLWLLGVAGIELWPQEVDVGPPRLTEPSFTQTVNPRGVATDDFLIWQDLGGLHLNDGKAILSMPSVEPFQSFRGKR